MDAFLSELQQNIETVDKLGNLIENGECYMDELKADLPIINQMVQKIFGLMTDPQIQLEISREFVLQVLNDIIYGVEQDDPVFLLDVLRYGLLEIYYFVGAELQGEIVYE